VRELAAASDLPLPDDVEGSLPRKEAELIERVEGERLLTAFVRRVKARRLWVWYVLKAHHVVLVLVTKVPP
jgi:hypothetical protein